MSQKKIQLLATDPRSLWTPAQLPDALHWWRADLGITLSAGQAAAWVDQISGKTLAQSTGANQPDYSASEANFNGQAALEFTNVDSQYMTSSGLSFSAGDDMSVIIVMRQKTPLVTGLALSQGGPLASTNMFYIGNVSSQPNKDIIAYGTFNASSNSSYVNETNDNAPHFAGLTYSAAGELNIFSSEEYITPAGVISTDATINSFQEFSLGRFGYTGASYYDGYVAEIIVTKSFLEEQDLEDLADYLRLRYDIDTQYLTSTLTQEKVYLDTYDESPLLLNLQIDDYQELPTVNSNFSRSFRIPATNINNQFFESIFDVNSVDFDISKKVPCEILVDGEFFKRGQLRLSKIFTNEFSDRTDYEVFFLGESKDFAAQVGEGFLNSLLCFDLDHEVLMSNIVTSWNAEAGTTNGLLDGNVVYPLIDYGYSYEENSGFQVPQQNQVGYDSGSYYTNGFSNSGKPILRQQFRPWIRAKYLIDRIFALTDYSYTSNFFDSDRFDQMYVNATGNDAFPTLDGETETSQFIVQQPSQLFSPSLGRKLINWPIELLDPNNVISGSTFTAPIDGDYQFDIEIDALMEIDAPGDLTIELQYNINGGVSYTNVDSITILGNIVLAGTLSGSFTETLSAGDTIRMWLNFSRTGTGVGVDLNCSNGQWELNTFPIELTNPCALLQDNVKIIDFFKSIINQFKLVVAPDPESPFNFVIEPYADYIGSGEVRDWTEKLDTSRDFQLQPVFFNNSATVYFQNTSDEDVYNRLNEVKFKEAYGTKIYDSAEELLNGSRVIQPVFSSTPLAPIIGQDNPIVNWNQFNLPRLCTEEVQNEVLGYALVAPVRPNIRLCFYNGLKDVDSGGSPTSWYYANDAGTAVANTTYPLVSAYEDVPTTSSSLNLNWENENTYYTQLTNTQVSSGISCYDEYWSDFVDAQYSPFARKFIGNFVLDHYDLQDFQFKDVIFVKNAYYRVLKVLNLPVGEKSSVQVELLKLLNYVPAVEPPVAPPVADFEWEWDEANNRVQFTDTSTNTPTSWVWTFSAGTPSSTTDQNPTLTGVLWDEITVTLTPTNAGGSGFDSQTFYVRPVEFADVQHWWRADTGITIGTGVSAWEDQVSALDLQQSTGANQPTSTTSATLNSKEVVQTNGSSTFLFTLSSPNSFSGSDRTWLAVFAVSSSTPGDGVLFGDTFLVSSGNGRNWVDGLSGNFRSFDQALSTAGSLGTTISAISSGAWALKTRYDSSAGDFFIAGNTLTETTKGTTGLTGQDYPAGTTVAMGASWRSTSGSAGVFGGRYIACDMAEIVCINGTPSAATMTAWKDYVNTRYGTIIT